MPREESVILGELEFVEWLGTFPGINGFFRYWRKFESCGISTILDVRVLANCPRDVQDVVFDSLASEPQGLTDVDLHLLRRALDTLNRNVRDANFRG